MNIEQLRQSVKYKWLSYYEEHRPWLVRLGVWVNCDGQRRPSSSFILATLTVLEPQFTQLLPLVVDLSSNPDRIVKALGLNFNPDEQLEAWAKAHAAKAKAGVKMLPGRSQESNLPPTPKKFTDLYSKLDETCEGVGGQGESVGGDRAQQLPPENKKSDRKPV